MSYYIRKYYCYFRDNCNSDDRNIKDYHTVYDNFEDALIDRDEMIRDCIKETPHYDDWIPQSRVWTGKFHHSAYGMREEYYEFCIMEDDCIIEND